MEHKHIAKCADAGILFDRLNERQLDYIEEEIDLYEDLTPEDYADLHDGYPTVIQWYEGCLSTSDLLDFMADLR